MATICLTQNIAGHGGISGRQGNQGQASLQAEGNAARSYGFPVLSITTGMTATMQLQLTQDLAGTIPSDMTGVSSIHFVARPSMVCYQDTIQVDCVNKGNGIIELTLTPTLIDEHQGLYYAQIHCMNAAGALIKSFRCYLQIERGMSGAYQGNSYPLTVMDVRMAIMDTSAQANEALDDLQFSDVMILHAVHRAVAQWNQTPPTLAQQFTASSFPYREFLLKGAVGYLLQMVAYRYTRNRMQHQAAGMAYDNNDKGPAYLQMAAMARQEYKDFVASKKTQHNFSECFGIMSEPWFGSSSTW